MTAHFSPEERETTITTSDADELVRVWTAQRKHITRLRKDSAFTQVRTGFHGTTEWAEFTIPADRWSPAGVRRKRPPLTEEQRQAAADRLRKARGESLGLLTEGAHRTDSPSLVSSPSEEK